jgi:hypothetical protein
VNVSSSRLVTLFCYPSDAGQDYAAGDAYRELQRLRGTVKFSVKLRKLREDRG